MSKRITVAKKKTGKGYQVNKGGKKVKSFLKKSTANAYAKKLRAKK